jgi:hypothetical protein
MRSKEKLAKKSKVPKYEEINYYNGLVNYPHLVISPAIKLYAIFSLTLGIPTSVVTCGKNQLWQSKQEAIDAFNASEFSRQSHCAFALFPLFSSTYGEKPIMLKGINPTLGNWSE